MAITSALPVSGSIISRGTVLSIDTDQPIASSTINIISASGTEIAWDGSTYQAGFTGSASESAGNGSFTFKRDAGWLDDTFTVQIVAGGTSTVNYQILAEGEYPPLMEPFNEPVGGAAPVVGSLDDLTDVDTTGAAINDALVYDGSEWVPGTGGGDVPSTRTLTAGTGLTGGGDLSADRTFNVNVGTGPNDIVQLDASSRLPAVDGSQITNLTLPAIAGDDQEAIASIFTNGSGGVNVNNASNVTSVTLDATSIQINFTSNLPTPYYVFFGMRTAGGITPRVVLPVATSVTVAFDDDTGTVINPTNNPIWFDIVCQSGPAGGGNVDFISGTVADGQIARYDTNGNQIQGGDNQPIITDSGNIVMAAGATVDGSDISVLENVAASARDDLAAHEANKRIHGPTGLGYWDFSINATVEDPGAGFMRATFSGSSPSLITNFWFNGTDALGDTHALSEIAALVDNHIIIRQESGNGGVYLVNTATEGAGGGWFNLSVTPLSSTVGTLGAAATTFDVLPGVASGEGVTDHGSLTGLLGTDHHTQYLNEARHDLLPADNPHSVTKAQVGLGNVDNTADADKQISDLTQAALNTKAGTALFDTASATAGLTPGSVTGGTTNFLRADGTWNAPAGSGTGYQPGLGVWAFDTATTATDPGAAKFKFNAGQTELYINDANLATLDQSALITVSGASYLVIQDTSGNPATVFRVDSIVDNTGWFTLDGAVEISLGSLVNGTNYSFDIYRGAANTTLDGLSDTNINTVASGDFLKWDGTDWVNVPAAAINVTFNNTTSGLTAVNTQAAIDEVEGRVDTLETDNTGINTGDITLGGTNDYLSLAGQVLTPGTLNFNDDIGAFTLSDFNNKVSGGPVAKFNSGATLPAAGIPGRYYFQTTDSMLYRDTGGATPKWEPVGAPSSSFGIGQWSFIGSASEAVAQGEFSTNNANPGSVTSLKIYESGDYKTGSATMLGGDINPGDRFFFSAPRGVLIGGEPSTVCFRVDTGSITESAGQVTIPVVTEAFNGSVFDSTLPYSVALVRGGSAWGSITGTLSAQNDLQTELDNKANFSTGASLPAFGNAGDYFFRTSDNTLHRDSGTSWVQVGGAHEDTVNPDNGVDDIDLGYRPGSIWVNTTTSEVWVCESNANGAAAWLNVSAAGSGTVDTSGTPVALDFARFTDSNSIEGRSYAEARADLSLEVGGRDAGSDVQAWSAELDGIAAATGTQDATTYLAGDDTYKTVPLTQHSIVVAGGFANLVGDEASPGNTKLYGTNAFGTRGWYDQPAGGPGGTDIPSGVWATAPPNPLVGTGAEGDYYMVTDRDETLWYRNATDWVVVNDVVRDTLANQGNYDPTHYPGAFYQVTDTNRQKLFVSGGTPGSETWVEVKIESGAIRITDNNRLLGNISGSAALAQELTVTEARSLLGVSATFKARVATTADVGTISTTTLLGAGDTIDDVVLAAGDRVLVKDQTTASENGIWVVGSGADDPPTRPSDFDAGASVGGELIVVMEGTAAADTFWFVKNNSGSDVVGTDNLDIAQTALAGVVDAGQITTGTFDNGRIAETNVTQHEAAIDHDQLANVDSGVTGGDSNDRHRTILHTVAASRPAATVGAGVYHMATDTWVLTVSDGATWQTVTTPSGGALTDLSDATITSPATDAALIYNGSQWIDGTLNTAGITDNAVTLAKIATKADTNAGVLGYDGSGNPVEVQEGTSGQVLTSNGAGTAPSFQDAAGGNLGFGGWTAVSTTPGVGEVQYNNATKTSTTTLTFHFTPETGPTIATIANFKKLLTAGSRLAVWKKDDPAADNAYYEVTAVAGTTDGVATVVSLGTPDTASWTASAEYLFTVLPPREPYREWDNSFSPTTTIAYRPTTFPSFTSGIYACYFSCDVTAIGGSATLTVTLRRGVANIHRTITTTTTGPISFYHVLDLPSNQPINMGFILDQGTCTVSDMDFQVKEVVGANWV